MPVPTWSVGQVLAAADVNNWFVPIAAYKTTDLGRNTTSQTADPDLVLAVAANAVYFMDGVLFYKSATLGTNFQWTFTTPAGSSNGLYHAMYTGSGGGFVTEANGWLDPAHSAGTAASSTVYPVTIRGQIATGGTSGNITLLWAASSATPVTTLTARSFLTLQRLG